MKFAVFFEDNPGVGDLRMQHMADHLAFLKRNKDKIDAAGPLLDGTGGGAGGLWLVDVASENEAQALVEDDPFWPTGLRKSVRILTWKQVFVNGRSV